MQRLIQPSRQQGAVLGMTLLFMGVLTGLVVAALANAVIAAKDSQSFRAQLTALTAAEAGLLVAEAKLNNQTVSMPTTGAQVTTQTAFQGVDDCQCPWYVITVNARYLNAVLVLQSGYRQAHTPALPMCVGDDSTARRLWWQQLAVSV